MLLQELKRITEIDQEIGTLHEKLKNLYVERSGITVVKSQSSISIKNTVVKKLTTESAARLTYDQLALTWNKLDISIPSFTKLRSKITKADSVIKVIKNARPEIGDEWSVLLVPPSELVGCPVSPELRSKQGFIKGNDFVGTDLKIPKGSRLWRVFVVYSSSNNLHLGNANQIISDKSYVIAGYDMRGLGLHEYAALSLQAEKPIDSRSWTLLLRDIKNNNIVQTVAALDKQFRFDTDESDSVFDDSGFRPALEIN